MKKVLLDLLIIVALTFSNEVLPIDPVMKLVNSRGKAFNMGSKFGEPDEQPVRQVNFSYDFWIDSTEVCQWDYEKLMAGPFGYKEYDGEFYHSDFGGSDDLHPVYDISWYKAVLYCNARSKRDGRDTAYSYDSLILSSWHDETGMSLSNLNINYDCNGYRLPTEAEWEYAARGGLETSYFWGKNFLPYPASSGDSIEVNFYAIWDGNSGMLDYMERGVRRVASRYRNPYGLYDMLGNVSEWCNDWYDSYNIEETIDPVGPKDGMQRVNRGGSWNCSAYRIRVSNRLNRSADFPMYLTGFRTVCKEINEENIFCGNKFSKEKNDILFNNDELVVVGMNNGVYRVIISDPRGRIVYKSSFNITTQHNQSIPIKKNISTGIYFLNIDDRQNNIAQFKLYID